MIVTDWNKMTVEELMAIHVFLNANYVIEDGKITEAKEEK